MTSCLSGGRVRGRGAGLATNTYGAERFGGVADAGCPRCRARRLTHSCCRYSQARSRQSDKSMSQSRTPVLGPCVRIRVLCFTEAKGPWGQGRRGTRGACGLAQSRGFLLYVQSDLTGGDPPRPHSTNENTAAHGRPENANECARPHAEMARGPDPPDPKPKLLPLRKVHGRGDTGGVEKW